MSVDIEGVGTDANEPGGAAPVTQLRLRTPELVVSALLMVVALIVISDSLRVGTGWADDGPRAGYFPFYIGLLLLGASATIFITQLWRWRRSTEDFAEHRQLRLVLAVLLPMVAFVAAIAGLGIYLASALLLAYFIQRYGEFARGRTAIAVAVALTVPLLFYVVFERWFLVPLPKGPLENWLGL